MDSASPHAQDRVLVVEDEPGVGELLCRLLAGFGYSSQLAANADDAMQRMLSTPFSVVLSDICMPGIDGLELTRWTKERFPLTEVVLITGHSSIETAVRAMQLGACDYLIKPLSDPTCVDRSLNLALERRRRALALRSNPRLWLAGLVEHLPLAVVLVDSDRKLLAANRLGQEMLTLGQTLLLGDGNTVACVDTAATSRLACLVRAAHASGSHLEALDLGACTGAVLGLGDDGPDRVAAIALPAGLARRSGSNACSRSCMA